MTRVLPGEPLTYLLAHLDTDTADCMLWPYAVNKHGYGVIRYEGRMEQVHVLACIHHHGPRPAGMEVAHAPIICHARSCFNGRRHLSWKTRRANHADKVADGTHQVGERNPRAKLDRVQVAEIRSRFADGGLTKAALAREFAVDPKTILQIVSGRTWSDPSLRSSTC